MVRSPGNKSRAPSRARSSRLDTILRGAFHGSLIALAVVGGALLAAVELFPGPQVASAHKAGRALYDKLTTARVDNVYQSDLWYPKRSEASGVTVHDPARSSDDLVLYTSGHSPTAFLMRKYGDLVHTWTRPYSTVWNKAARVKSPQPDSHVFFRKARVFPNGDLLAIYEGVGDTPYGYGLVKLDRDSNVLWSYLDHTHHDLDVGPDGRVYVLTHEFDHATVGGFEHLARPRLDDFLVVLTPDGQELQRVSLTRAVAKSRYGHLLHTVSIHAIADPLHANAVDVITPETAENFPFGEPGQVMLSFRELGAIFVLDLDSEEFVWSARSYWIGQHDPDILPNGNILLFDNYGQYHGPEGISRVIEFDPRDMRLVWQYTGTADRPLESAIRSSQQRLSSGNTLITESNGGRILEVTREGDVVWEFINPVSGGEKNEKLPITAAAEGFRLEYFTSDFLEEIEIASQYAVRSSQ